MFVYQRLGQAKDFGAVKLQGRNWHLLLAARSKLTPFPSRVSTKYSVRSPSCAVLDKPKEALVGNCEPATVAELIGASNLFLDSIGSGLFS